MTNDPKLTNTCATDNPYSIDNPGSTSPLLLVCDHASNRVPQQYAQLGLDAALFSEHMAWDIGALGVSRILGTRFDATVVSSRYSRLLVDLNRFPGHPTWMPASSDEITIPGNQNLDSAERDHRATHYFWPYQNAVGSAVARIVARGQTPVVVSIHSFTPALRNGTPRPWHYGVLWNEDDNRLATPLMQALRTDPAICVGDNQPYHAKNPEGFTVKTHAEDAGYPHALIEIRQDLIDSDAGIAQRAHQFGDALQVALNDNEYFQ